MNTNARVTLKAMDTENNFVFESVGLTQKSAPIIRYDWDRRKMKKEEWRRYEDRIYEQAGVFARSYEQAGVFARSTGTRILIVDDGPQGSRRLSENDNWSEYHITLERYPALAQLSYQPVLNDLLSG